MRLGQWTRFRWTRGWGWDRSQWFPGLFQRQKIYVVQKRGPSGRGNVFLSGSREDRGRGAPAGSRRHPMDAAEADPGQSDRRAVRVPAVLIAKRAMPPSSPSCGTSAGSSASPCRSTNPWPPRRSARPGKGARRPVPRPAPRNSAPPSPGDGSTRSTCGCSGARTGTASARSPPPSRHGQIYAGRSLRPHHGRWGVEEMFKTSKAVIAVDEFHGRTNAAYARSCTPTST